MEGKTTVSISPNQMDTLFKNPSHKMIGKNMPDGKKAMAIIAAVSFVLALSGCIVPWQVQGNDDSNSTVKLQAQEMPRFTDHSQLKAAFENAGGGRVYGFGDMLRTGIAIAPMMARGMETQASTSADSGKSSQNIGANYSKTNVQVEGVDEADIVKSDGKYIYAIAKNRLVIVDAYPAQGGRIVSETDLNGLSPQEMFIFSGKLLLFSSANGYGYYGYDAMPAVKMPARWGGGSVVQLYDITDKAAPKLGKEIEFTGNYLTSRLIDGKAVFVINSYPNYHYGYGAVQGADRGSGSGSSGASGAASGANSIIPLMREEGVEKPIAQPQDIGYIPPMPVQSFVTIAMIDLDSGIVEKETFAGSAQAVFASETNIYITSTAYLPPQIPVLREIDGAQKISRAIYGDYESTVVNKFNFSQGKISFIGQGSVPGQVLNQFSMDEYSGNFRIATTVNNYEFGGQQKNNLYVLGPDMNLLGKLEGLAPGERIYSARFMGKKAYLVTFKKVDPLFVIDVSDPSEPKVLGKLKIPGYSDYLHPIDENHIIGIGKDAVDSGYGDFAWYQGMKMAIFDVSDVSAPKELHKIIIGDRGTDSYALRDHRAFLYDAQRQLLVLPIELHEIPEGQKGQQDGIDAKITQGPGAGSTGANVAAPSTTISPQGISMPPAYGEPVFQGAFVYKVTLEKGFEELGRITHVGAQEELKRGYYFDYSYMVKRALYIEDVLYTLSDQMLRANMIPSLEGITSFRFAKEELPAGYIEPVYRAQ